MVERSFPTVRSGLAGRPFVLSGVVLVALLLFVYALSLPESEGSRDLRGRYGNTTTQSYVGEGVVDPVTGAALGSATEMPGGSDHIFPVRPDTGAKNPE